MNSEYRIVGKILTTRDGIYAYDTCSNEILHITQCDKIIIESLIKGYTQSKIEKHLYSKLPHLDARNEIKRFNRRRDQMSVFQPIQLRSVSTGPCNDCICEALEHKLTGLTLNVTEQCNFRCKYCVFGGAIRRNRQHSNRIMSWEVARKAIDFYVERADVSGESLIIGFYGGEPFLCLDLLEKVVSYVQRSKHNRICRFNVTTNGSFLCSRKVREFITRNELWLLVSLDGPAHIHNESRITKDGNPTHALVEKGLKLLLKENPDYFRKCVQFNAVVTRKPNNLIKILNYYKKSNLYRKSLGLLRISGVRKDEYPAMTASDRELAARNYSNCRDRFIRTRQVDPKLKDELSELYGLSHARIAQRTMGPLPPQVIPSGFCIPGARKLFVSTTGTLGFCERIGTLVPIGNVQNGFDMVAVDKIIREMCSKWTSKCSFCWAQRFCSICQDNIIIENGIFSDEIFQNICESNKSSLEDSLTTFIEICNKNTEYLDVMKDVHLV